MKPFISPEVRPEKDFPDDLNDPPDEMDDQDMSKRNGDDEQDPAELMVKAILDEKIIKNRSGCRQTFYLVQWEDEDIELSWEPLRNLY